MLKKCLFRLGLITVWSLMIYMIYGIWQNPDTTGNILITALILQGQFFCYSDYKKLWKCEIDD